MIEEQLKPSDVTDATAIFPKNYGYIKTSLPKNLFKSLKKECSVAEEWNRFITGLTEAYPNTSNHYEIKDARFHDLRRTFGYNLIKQGRPIYEVSKLLGHSSVTTTERHYAPLLTTEIEDFVL